MATHNPGAHTSLELPDGLNTTSDDQIRRTKNKIRRRKSRFVPKFGCFRSDFDIPSLEQRNDDGSMDMVSATSTGDNRARSPSHLVVMINGIVGSAKNWRYAAKLFVKKYPEQVIVHCSRSNHTTLTFDGVDVMGRRLVYEVISVIERNPSVEKISFVAHSLGGLVVRYAIALLYGTNYLKLFPTENGEERINGSTKDSIEEKYKGKIAGLEPANYITFATPHLGSLGHNQVPLFCNLRKLEKLARRSSWMLGRTGRHLFLTDRGHGNPPLLLQMSNDFEDLPFISALQSFKRRIVYANVRFDQMVGWCTSSIRHPAELPQRNQLCRHERFKHVVNREPAKTSDPQKVYSQESIVDGWKNLSTEEMIEVMLNGLRKLSWERVDVKFNGVKQRFLAHSTIQVQFYCLHSAGVDVVEHLLENFDL